MYYVVDLSESGPEEIAAQLRGAAHNIEIARRRDLVVCVAPAYGKDLELGFSGHASSARLAAAYEAMGVLDTYRPERIFARSEDEVAVVRAAAPGVKVELERGVPDVTVNDMAEEG